MGMLCVLLPRMATLMQYVWSVFSLKNKEPFNTSASTFLEHVKASTEFHLKYVNMRVMDAQDRVTW